MKRVSLCLGFILLLLYLLFTGSREHLTPGPPTLHSLQKDGQELEKKIEKLDAEFQQMKQQASEGANQAAAARLQLSTIKSR